jgi:hypothetical protein
MIKRGFILPSRTGRRILTRSYGPTSTVHAPKIRERAVANLRSYFGRFERTEKAVDLDGVMREIDDARFEEAARRLRLQEPTWSA